ncbi:hypothetical protein L21SP3_00212 [Sedimentisphaera cyanobacteriorum]|uniref:HEAT repeat n=1 Tax=Sedimentisphaera cyanobacteriorum TaxID=1940790 RepID=A0A1Q2HMJ5_9BACT|nr:hypothetical protein [Sedimentisphaera cyanobacteriorum]AQQ08436.1 hypothetical protein L21SP3_00212 [Sedimentisphaera cyanobacteriorum]
MNIKTTLQIFVLLLLLTASGERRFAFADDENEKLEIYKSTLSSDKEPQMRVSAAKQILLSNQQNEALEIIKDVFSSGSAESQQAVLKAIENRNSWEKKLPRQQEYINILIDFLCSSDAAMAQRGAESLSGFDYSQYSEQLKEKLLSEKTGKKGKLNILHTISLNLTKKKAVEAMIAALDLKDREIAKKAAEILQGWAPEEDNSKVWEDYIKELKEKSPEQIIENKLTAQNKTIKELQSYSDRLKNELLDTLNRLYDTTEKTEQRVSLIIEKLESPNFNVRLWAVGKAEQWRSNAEVPNKIKEKLKTLISDEKTQVRKATAELMVYLAESNPSQELYTQLQRETNPEAKLAQFEALTESCYFGLLQSSEVKVEPEVRVFALNTAKKMIQNGNRTEVLSAVESIRKLLDRNGISEDQTREYFTAILKKYQSAVTEDQDFASEILKRSAGLFAQNAHYRSIAVKLFEPALSQTLSSKNGKLLGAAVSCLEVISKSDLLQKIRSSELYNRSEQILAKSLQTASQAGNEKDIKWIESKINQMPEQAADTLKSIMKRTDGNVSDTVVSHLQSYDMPEKKKVELLEAAMQKNNLSIESFKTAANAFYSRDMHQQAASCYRKIMGGDSLSPQQQNRALNVFAAVKDYSGFSDVLKMVISRKDFTKDSQAHKLTLSLLNDKEISKEDKAGFLKKITSIPATGKPEWKKFLDSLAPEPEKKKQEKQPKNESKAAEKPAETKEKQK